LHHLFAGDIHLGGVEHLGSAVDGVRVCDLHNCSYWGTFPTRLKAWIWPALAAPVVWSKSGVFQATIRHPDRLATTPPPPGAPRPENDSRLPRDDSGRWPLREAAQRDQTQSSINAGLLRHHASATSWARGARFHVRRPTDGRWCWDH
jgi:hypothetical protein